MPVPTSLLEAREGRTQMDVLAAIGEAQYQDDVQPRQRDLVDRLPISKGAVSNNCAKLVDSGLVVEEERTYRIDEEVLLDLYREHVDAYLAREPRSEHFEVEVAAYNETRTTFKRELRDLIEGNELILAIVTEALVNSKDDSRYQTLREVFHHADLVARQAAAHVVTSEHFEGRDDDHWSELRTLFLLAVAFTRVHEELDALQQAQPLLDRYFPGEPPENEMTAYVNGGSK